jgi:glycosyltransferase involved in cell wall biosynthesis
MEAMLASCVPVVARCGGPALIVNDACGYAVPAVTPEQLASDIVGIVQKLATEPELIHNKGSLARKRIIECFSENAYWRTLKDCYAECMTRQNGDGFPN